MHRVEICTTSKLNAHKLHAEFEGMLVRYDWDFGTYYVIKFVTDDIEVIMRRLSKHKWDHLNITHFK